MKTTSLRARTLACALLATTAYCGLAARPAAAQTARDFRQLDANGVDLVHGDFVMAFEEGSIGSGRGELALIRRGAGGLASQWDGISFRLTKSGSLVSILIKLGDGTSDTFTGGTLSTVFTPAKANGATLTRDTNAYTYIYRLPDGTAILFGDPTGGDSEDFPSGYCTFPFPTESCDLLPLQIASPDGGGVYLEWLGPLGAPATLYRVVNSHGYSIGFGYSGSDRSSADFYNEAVSATVPQASVSYAYPSAGVVDVTDMAGNAWRITATSIRRPGESNAGFTVSGTAGAVTGVTRDGVTTSYARSVSGSTATMTVTDALSQATTVVSDLDVGRPTSITDPLGRTTSFTYDSGKRLKRVTQPEGNYVEHSYDARSNVTQTQRVPKSGSGAATIAVSASYPSTCGNLLTCNSPTSITDARGNVTDYTYDSAHGGVLTATAPAPTAGATRPQTRYSYTLTNGEYLLTGVSACRTTSSCSGTADEMKSSLVYDSQGNVTSTSSGNGSGTLTATTAMTYNAMGDVATVDGPLSGTADTVRFRYDAARRQVGAISADPDGGGALKHRAVKKTIGTAGQVTKVESGTVNSQSDTDWAAFAPLEAVETGYDANMRPTTQKLVSGSTPYALTQMSYDALGRPECTAQRMNPNEFASLPASACTLDTQGSFGPDRITKTIRDAAGQVTQVKTALGVTGQEANEVTSTYTSNGLVQTVTDAENNKTTYEYDGHDRLAKTRFPSPTKGAGTSSTTDYEQPTYDANGNVTSFRNRANETASFTLDALDRPTAKNLPGSEPDVSYTYDLLGRMTSASQSGHSLGFTYDALGRNLTQAGPHGTVTSTWDIAGRRTRITYPGTGLYVDQDYLVTGELTKIRENGATSGVGVLATFAYDNLGRRTSLTRGNGTVSSYTYDAVSRLSQLTDNPAGTTYDQTLGFAYNPASQIASNTRSNDLFAWTGHGSGTTSTTADGLNQITVHGGASTSHDARGNMTADGLGKTFGYSSENLLTSGSGGVNLAYDPGMRLYQVAGGTTTRFAYDGAALIAEYNGSNSLQRRFVHGPGVDEPLVWYEGSGTTDRRFLHSDERGSVTAVSNGSGSVTNVNTYDEYGKPGSSNAGRFQYTGQKWSAELGLYDYKARMYHPGLPRFLQTDPIGYGDGMNLYAYVGGDPVNFVDPTGTEEDPPIVITGSRCPRGWTCYSPEGSYYSTLARVDDASNETIVVTGRRPGRRRSPTPPGTPVGSTPLLDTHLFQFDRDLTRADSQCTAAHVAGAIQRYAVPGNDGVRVQDGRTYAVRVLGVKLGRVRVETNRLAVTNRTLPGHWMFDGTIKLYGYPKESGGFAIRVRGEGNNYPGVGLVNEAGGPIQFKGQVQKMKDHLIRTCGG